MNTTIKIINHINNLNDVAPIKNFESLTDENKLTMYRSLRRLECKAERVAALGCENERYINSGKFESDAEKIEKKLQAYFYPPEGRKRIFFNRDPRGYALKIETGYTGDCVTDWGDYIIIAPETSKLY